MTYADLIRQWFDRSKSENDFFTKLIFLYISFIAFLTRRHSEKNDREIIEFLKSAEDAKGYYTSLIRDNSELRATIESLISELQNQPIENSTRSNNPHWSGPKDGVIRNKTDWENLVEFWYRVRNNLFHGHKAPDFERDQKLVKYAYLTLLPLMENFIKHNLAWKFN